jgi:hypothetical protein
VSGDLKAIVCLLALGVPLVALRFYHMDLTEPQFVVRFWWVYAVVILPALGWRLWKGR